MPTFSGAGDAAVTKVFGETLLLIMADALARNSFGALPLRDDCQLDCEEFDAMWAWKDSLANIPAVRLPK